MTEKGFETATLGGGCFWCLEAAYAEIAGVVEVESGYAGGADPAPTYERVCSGTTGHAEVVRITYDPDVITYRDLLEVFFTIHDPTTLNRQGADVGTQYRSVIFYDGEEQKAIADQVIRDLEDAGAWDAPIVTEVSPLPEYHRAESYHQRYYERNPWQGYCQAVIAPKIAKLRKHHFDRLAKNRAPGQEGPTRSSGGISATDPSGQVHKVPSDSRDPLGSGGIAD